MLDDNRLLTMPSGERIQFGPNVNFIFETHDLKFASPATVSRMGMIFLDQVSARARARGRVRARVKLRVRVKVRVRVRVRSRARP